jgi:hypothetical protein
MGFGWRSFKGCRVVPKQQKPGKIFWGAKDVGKRGNDKR